MAFLAGLPTVGLVLRVPRPPESLATEARTDRPPSVSPLRFMIDQTTLQGPRGTKSAGRQTALETVARHEDRADCRLSEGTLHDTGRWRQLMRGPGRFPATTDYVRICRTGAAHAHVRLPEFPDHYH